MRKYGNCQLCCIWGAELLKGLKPSKGMLVDWGQLLCRGCLITAILMYMVSLKFSILFYVYAAITECIWHCNNPWVLTDRKGKYLQERLNKYTHTPCLHKTKITFLSISVFLKWLNNFGQIPNVYLLWNMWHIRYCVLILFIHKLHEFNFPPCFWHKKSDLLHTLTLYGGYVLESPSWQ